MIFCVQFPVYQLQPAGIMLEEFLLTRPDSVPCPALQTLLASYELALTWGNLEAILLLNLYYFFIIIINPKFIFNWAFCCCCSDFAKSGNSSQKVLP